MKYFENELNLNPVLLLGLPFFSLSNWTSIYKYFGSFFLSSLSICSNHLIRCTLITTGFVLLSWNISSTSLLVVLLHVSSVFIPHIVPRIFLPNLSFFFMCVLTSIAFSHSIFLVSFSNSGFYLLINFSFSTYQKRYKNSVVLSTIFFHWYDYL